MSSVLVSCSNSPLLLQALAAQPLPAQALPSHPLVHQSAGSMLASSRRSSSSAISRSYIASIWISGWFSPFPSGERLEYVICSFLSFLISRQSVPHAFYRNTVFRQNVLKGQPAQRTGLGREDISSPKTCLASISWTAIPGTGLRATAIYPAISREHAGQFQALFQLSDIQVVQAEHLDLWLALSFFSWIRLGMCHPFSPFVISRQSVPHAPGQNTRSLSSHLRCSYSTSNQPAAYWPVPGAFPARLHPDP